MPVASARPISRSRSSEVEGSEDPGSRQATPLQLTSRRDLAVAGLAGGLLGWLIVATVRLITKADPLLPWVGPGVLWFIALVLLVTAIVARRRFRTARAEVEPEQAVTFLVLGKTGALAGAIVGAGYAVFALMFVEHLHAAGPRDRVIRGAVAAVAGLVTMLSGLWLERQCRVPDGSGTDDDSGFSDEASGFSDEASGT